jgi:predicted metal-dependent hydrolase
MTNPHPRIAALLSTRRLRIKPAQKLVDSEFGVITCRRSATSRYVRLRLTPTGQLRATLPIGASVKHVQRLVDDSRDELRKLLREQGMSTPLYENGQRIGQSHRLEIIPVKNITRPAHKLRGQAILVMIPSGVDEGETEVQDEIRTAVKDALRREAKAYLPRRLSHLSEQYDLHYSKVRFAHQSGRWGSCSSSGTVSLNIALMNLPLELIDYVLTHELCHTVHMHHQASFWDLVESFMPDYRARRKLLKSHNPHI